MPLCSSPVGALPKVRPPTSFLRTSLQASLDPVGALPKVRPPPPRCCQRAYTFPRPRRRTSKSASPHLVLANEPTPSLDPVGALPKVRPPTSFLRTSLPSQHPLLFLPTQPLPFPWSQPQIQQIELPNPHPHQSQRRISHRSGHSPHLPILPLRQCQFDP